jgi:thymidylate synthase ThyX
MRKGEDTFVNNLLRGKSMAAHHRRKASRYKIKSARYSKLAAKTKLKIEKEARYVNKMKQTVKSIPKRELDAGYAFCKDFLNS